MFPPTTYISTKEAGRRLGIRDHETVVAMIHAGDLDGYAQTTAIAGRVHAWKVSEQSIDAYVARQQRRISA